MVSHLSFYVHIFIAFGTEITSQLPHKYHKCLSSPRVCVPCQHENKERRVWHSKGHSPDWELEAGEWGQRSLMSNIMGWWLYDKAYPPLLLQCSVQLSGGALLHPCSGAAGVLSPSLYALGLLAYSTCMLGYRTCPPQICCAYSSLETKREKYGSSVSFSCRQLYYSCTWSKVAGLTLSSFLSQ